MPRRRSADRRLGAVIGRCFTGFDEALAPLTAPRSRPKPITIDTLPPDLRATYIARDGRYRVQAFPAGKGADADASRAS